MDTNATTTVIAQGCKNMCVCYWELPVSPHINDLINSDGLWFCLDHDLNFSNSLIIHEEKTKEVTTVKEVWICDPNYHKIW